MIKVMSKKLVRKTIDMIKELADDEEEETSSDDEKKDDKKGDKKADGDKKEGEKKEGEKKEGEKEKKEKGKSDEEKKTESEDEVDDKYATFWKHFGKSIKLGVIEDSSNRVKLAKLLRFKSTDDPEKLTSLDEYISRMKDD